VHDTNDALYHAPFLSSARDVLRPGGALVIWSAAEAPELEQVLGEVFGDVSAQAREVLLQGRDEHYWLYAARVPSRG